MYLKTEELHRIQDYVVENGLVIPEVRDDVVDHLCCAVEKKIGEGNSFETAFQYAQQLIPENEIQEIQKDTIYYLTIKKRLIMIKAIFISGYSALVLLAFGIFFSIFGHVIFLPPIVGFALILGSVGIFCFGFLPLFFIDKYKKSIEEIKA